MHRNQNLHRRILSYSVIFLMLGISGLCMSLFQVVKPSRVESLDASKIAPRVADYNYNPNGPLIFYANPSTNNSYIQKPDEGVFTFIIDIIAGNGSSHTQDGHWVEGFAPQIEIEDTIGNFSDVSGNYSIWTYPWDMGDHKTNDVIMAKFNATNNNTWNELYLNFTIDADDPLVTVNAPTQLENITTNYVIRVQASDLLSGVESVDLTIEYLLSPFTKYTGIPLIYADGEWTYNWAVVTGDWAPGLYNLTLSVSDFAGNENKQSITVLVDYNAPLLDFYSPANYSDVAGITTLKVYARDLGTGLKNVTIQIGNQPAALMSPTTSTEFRSTGDFRGFAEQNVTVFVRSYDFSGIVNATSKNFTVDTILPVGTLTGPSAIAGLANFTLTSSDNRPLGHIQWRIDNSAYKSLYSISSQYIVFSSENYGDGSHLIQVVIQDSAGNQLVLNKNIYIDNTPPQVAVHNLQDGQIINQHFVLEAQVYDSLTQDIILKYMINGKNWIQTDPENGNDFWRIAIGQQEEMKSGANNITIRAYNSAGGYDEDFYYFIFDKPPAGDYLWILYVIGAAGIIFGIGYVYKKFRRTARDYNERVKAEAQHLKEQKGIVEKVEEEIGKVQITEGSLFKKAPKKTENTEGE